ISRISPTNPSLRPQRKRSISTGHGPCPAQPTKTAHDKLRFPVHSLALVEIVELGTLSFSACAAQEQLRTMPAVHGSARPRTERHRQPLGLLEQRERFVGM